MSTITVRFPTITTDVSLLLTAYYDSYFPRVLLFLSCVILLYPHITIVNHEKVGDIDIIICPSLKGVRSYRTRIRFGGRHGIWGSTWHFLTFPNS